MNTVTTALGRPQPMSIAFFVIIVIVTLAIPVGVAVIVIAFVLTAFYVAWANSSYDPEVDRLKGQLKK